MNTLTIVILILKHDIITKNNFIVRNFTLKTSLDKWKDDLINYVRMVINPALDTLQYGYDVESNDLRIKAIPQVLEVNPNDLHDVVSYYFDSCRLQ